jgi:hypothetical protein
VIRFCSNPDCGRSFVSLRKPPQDLCPTCRHHIGDDPLSRLVGGETREEVERRERQAQRRKARA